jgi:hypothetical protein
MSADSGYVRELLDDQLAFLLAQQDAPAVVAVPGLLQALRRDPHLSIHLDDLRGEADRLGRDYRDREYDGGNAGKMVQLAYEELGDKLAPGPALQSLLAHDAAFKRLLTDFDHPFTLPLPSTSDEALGRVSVLLRCLERYSEQTTAPILQIESTGHQDLVRRNAELQREARIRTRTEPSVALLRLEAIENLLIERCPYADSSPPAGGETSHPALRVEAVDSVRKQLRIAVNEGRLGTGQGALQPVVEDLHRSAQLLVLDLRRRLHTARSRVGVVLRFKARCEWHDRERLRTLADDARDRGRKPEHVLRDELNRYLFDQGLNPLAEAVLGTSSRADVFDPSLLPSFYVEAKQYQERAGVEGELRSAFRQALDTVGNVRGSGYALDEAFIVLFRRGGPRVVLPVEPFSAEGLRWHFVLINIAEASKDASQNRETPVEYSADELRAILFKTREAPATGPAEV